MLLRVLVAMDDQQGGRDPKVGGRVLLIKIDDCSS